MKKVFTLLKNLWKSARNYSDTNLQTAKDYTDTETNKILNVTTLLSDRTNMTTNIQYTLTDSIANYRLILIGVQVNSAEWKQWVKLPVAERYDCAWNVTDSLSWYVQLVLTFDGAKSVIVNKYNKVGFTTVKLVIHGLK